MKNIYLLVAITLLFSACGGDDPIIIPTGSIDILNIATTGPTTISIDVDFKIEGESYIDAIYIRRFNENMVLIDSLHFINGATNAVHSKTVGGFEKGKIYFIQAATHDNKMLTTVSDIINIKVPEFVVTKMTHQNTHLNLTENGVLPNEEIYIEGYGLTGFLADQDKEYKILINDMPAYANIISNSDSEITFDLGESVIDLFDKIAYCDTLTISVIDELNSGYEFDLRVFYPFYFLDSIQIKDELNIALFGGLGNSNDEAPSLYVNNILANATIGLSDRTRYHNQRDKLSYELGEYIMPGEHDLKAYYKDSLVFHYTSFLIE